MKRSSPPTAREAVSKLAFRPAMRMGRPVVEWMQVPVDFRLK